MKIHNIKKIPECLTYEYEVVSSFDDFDLEELKKTGMDEAWYWYAQGTDEGSGQILMRKGIRFFVHDCNHCSCYGPTDNISLKYCYASLSYLISSCTKEALEEIKPLVEMAQSQGYD